ncbi:MAG: alpha/beta hydrolase-fold protein [Candidatus Kapaibacterium sp.]
MHVAIPYEESLFRLLSETDAEARRHAARDLWEDARAEGALPLVHDDHVIFLYHGDVREVVVVGDWTYWQPATRLQRIEHTDLHYCILQFPMDARLQYKFVVDGVWVNDPGNDRLQAEGFGTNTEFVMPSYQDTSNAVPMDQAPKGSITPITLRSQILASDRDAYLYVPAGIAPETSHAVVLVHDGAEAIRLGHFATILDNLHATESIGPTAALFLPPRNRNEEYATSDAYIEFTAKEAMPQALTGLHQMGTRVSSHVQDMAVTGASLGGLLSTKTGLRHHDVFGTVIAQSPSYWWNKGEIFRSPFLRNARNLRMIIQTGTVCDAKDMASLMAQRLRASGGDVVYKEYAQGHTWGNWRSTFADAVRAWRGPSDD